ncbi:MAG TPA: type II CAAX endopeptidase family protein [Caulobacteraceae bacterium]|nr:type II CAAX endopeptidase family protein [Caulobacteraceae bacterium]
MHKLLNGVGTFLLASVIAVAILLVGQALWGGLVLVNLKLSPAIPWAGVVMIPLLAVIVMALGGIGWPRAGAATRRRLVPLRPVPWRVFAWAMVASAFGIAALAGLWIVLAGLTKTAPNALPSVRGVPPFTVAVILVVSIMAAPITEEIAFRGYVMGMLRRVVSPTWAILISSLLFAFAHLTQGLYADKLLVYFLAGIGIAFVAYRTGSLIPAMIAHSAADLTFFTLVWPHDAGRRLVSDGGADAWFWIHVGQVILFGGLCIWANLRLAKVTAGGPQAATPLLAHPAPA